MQVEDPRGARSGSKATPVTEPTKPDTQIERRGREREREKDGHLRDSGKMHIGEQKEGKERQRERREERQQTRGVTNSPAGHTVHCSTDEVSEYSPKGQGKQVTPEPDEPALLPVQESE